MFLIQITTSGVTITAYAKSVGKTIEQVKRDLVAQDIYYTKNAYRSDDSELVDLMMQLQNLEDNSQNLEDISQNLKDIPQNLEEIQNLEETAEREVSIPFSYGEIDEYAICLNKFLKVIIVITLVYIQLEKPW